MMTMTMTMMMTTTTMMMVVVIADAAAADTDGGGGGDDDIDDDDYGDGFRYAVVRSHGQLHADPAIQELKFLMEQMILRQASKASKQASKASKHARKATDSKRSERALVAFHLLFVHIVVNAFAPCTPNVVFAACALCQATDCSVCCRALLRVSCFELACLRVLA